MCGGFRRTGELCPVQVVRYRRHSRRRRTIFRTRTGELTVSATAVSHLAKNLLPLPEKWHGLTDVETRFRQRYVDLIVNPEVRSVFVKQAASSARFAIFSMLAVIWRLRHRFSRRSRVEPLARRSDAPQRPRYSALHEDCPRALSEAFDRRRDSQGLRNEPDFQE